MQKFNIGDTVTFINDFGLKFPEHTVIGFEREESGEIRYQLDTDSWWCPVKESNLLHDRDDEVIKVVNGHRIRHLRLDGEDGFLVGLTGHRFLGKDKAIEFALSAPDGSAGRNVITQILDSMAKKKADGDGASWYAAASDLMTAVARALYAMRNAGLLQDVSARSIRENITLDNIIDIATNDSNLPLDDIDPIRQYLKVRLPGFNIDLGLSQDPWVLDQHDFLVNIINDSLSEIDENSFRKIEVCVDGVDIYAICGPFETRFGPRKVYYDPSKSFMFFLVKTEDGLRAFLDQSEEQARALAEAFVMHQQDRVSSPSAI